MVQARGVKQLPANVALSAAPKTPLLDGARGRYNRLVSVPPTVWAVS
jgi:hypothetical protein